jgi:hypothetical protein
VKLEYSGSNGPASYGFQTRHGGMGLLQITSLASDTSGVRIRYKLVQSAQGSSL